MIKRTELEKAARCYNGEEYGEEFYRHNLQFLQDARRITESLREAVRNLFLWKLGKIRNNQTPSSKLLKFRDSIGRTYYGIPTTRVNEAAIQRATAAERLRAGISFRDGSFGYERIKSYANEITSSSIVLKVFYIHVWRPAEYPIIDDRVWKFYCHENEISAFRHTRPKSWEDYDAYRFFFQKIVEYSGLEWMVVDRALWLLGGDIGVRETSKRKNRTKI
jgi:hypothetical protein